MLTQEMIQQFKKLQQKIDETIKLLKIEDKKQELKILDKEMSSQGFWDNQDGARKKSQKASDLRDEINEWENQKKEIQELLSLARSDDKDLEEQLLAEFEKITKKFKELEFFILFNGKYDKNNTIMTICAGAGGVDAQDWAEILLRMYLRFCEKKNWKVSIVDESKGQEAGVKSVTLHVLGQNSFGFLKSENGVHRLIRISPFDAESMRHTSFSSVDILPELDDVEEIEIKEDDIKIETFKASGHGGQGVNTTDSAVRIIHVPTNIKVVCRNERSQLQNKETAMKILRAKLLEHREQEKEEEKKELRGDVQKVEWGSQIRSYVMHPYKMVKDHRTNYETQEIEKVLDGDIDLFIQEYLKNLKK